MRALYRCVASPQACPSAGGVVRLGAQREQARCPACGRPFTLKGTWNARTREWLSKWPSHRSREQIAHERELVKKGQALAQTSFLVSSANRALKTKAPGAKARTQKAVKQLMAAPPSVRRDRQITRLEGGLANLKRARKNIRALAMPRDSNKIVKILLDESNIDDGAVEPNDWIEFLMGLLPDKVLVKIAKAGRYKQIRAGMVALVRAARPRTWADLEDSAFAGQEPVLTILRRFPGLEALQLPSTAYEALAYQAQADDIPF